MTPKQIQIILAKIMDALETVEHRIEDAGECPVYQVEKYLSNADGYLVDAMDKLQDLTDEIGNGY